MRQLSISLPLLHILSRRNLVRQWQRILNVLDSPLSMSNKKPSFKGHICSLGTSDTAILHCKLISLHSSFISLYLYERDTFFLLPPAGRLGLPPWERTCSRKSDTRGCLCESRGRDSGKSWVLPTLSCVHVSSLINYNSLKPKIMFIYVYS